MDAPMKKKKVAWLFVWYFVIKEAFYLNMLLAKIKKLIIRQIKYKYIHFLKKSEILEEEKIKIKKKQM